MKDPTQPSPRDNRINEYRRGASTSFRLGWFVAIAVFFAANNVAVVPLTFGIGPRDEAAVFVFAATGIIFAEGGLVAMLGVFGTSAFASRMVIGFGAGVLLYACWAIGFLSASYSYYLARDIHFPIFEISWKMFLCLPMVYLSIQLPLWIARIFFRWTVERPDDIDKIPSRNALTIREMMIVTGIVAGALAAARLTEGGEFLSGTGFWLAMLMTMSITAGISLISTLPMTVIILRTRKTATAAAWLVIYYGIATAVPLGIRVVFIKSWGTLDPFESICFAIFVAEFLIWLAIPLCVVRHSGYRLRWGSESINSRSDLVSDS